MLIDYRWYTAHQVTPLFPFGHGLSYTIFQYTNLVVNSATREISLSVQNTGSKIGSEVVQLYLQFPVK